MPAPFIKNDDSSKKSLSGSMKRKKNNSDNSAINFDQMVPGASKHQCYDFSNDPKVIEIRKRILSSTNNTPSGSEALQYSFIASSDGSFHSQNEHRPFKKFKQTGFNFDTEFKSASGRPLVKEVLPVSTHNASFKSLFELLILCHTTCSVSEDWGKSEKDKTQRYLGGRKVVGTANHFLAPILGAKENDGESLQKSRQKISDEGNEEAAPSKREGWKADALLKHFDDGIIETIETEIMSKRTDIKWADVAGLEATKKALKEIIVLPFLRPDIFTGIRAPPKGVLLFGPPGTGKTMIGRCVAAQCKATFFNIAASSITSKWVGEGEKLVRALFAIARVLQPSVIFIDEIDSLLTTRSDKEHESSRRIKTEFLIRLDGVATTSDERILILGATNRPQELDAAVKRRFAKRLYIGLPCSVAREQMVRSLLSDQKHELTMEDVQRIAKLTDGYSGADMKQLCTEAAMGPVRNIVDSSTQDIASISADDIRPIRFTDFEDAMRFVRPTVVAEDLESYQDWNRQYGSFAVE